MKSPIIFRIFKNDQIQFVKQFVNQEQIVVGQQSDSSEQVDIPLDSKDISPIHCLIEKRGQDYFLCDLGSAIGTYKNGQQVVDDKINVGDEILVGPYKLIFLTLPALAQKNQSNTTLESQSVVAAPEKDVLKIVELAVQEAKKVEPVKQERVVTEQAKAEPIKIEISKPEIQAAISKNRPVLKDTISYKTKLTRHQKTFSPGNVYDKLNQFIRVGTGDSIQVITSWKGRVLETKTLKPSGVYKGGAGQILQLPKGTIPENTALIDCTAGVQILVPSDTKVEIKKDNDIRTVQETRVKLSQNEVVYLQFINGIEIAIRYVQNNKAVPMDSPVMLTSSELTGILCALIIASLTSLIVTVYTPKQNLVEEDVQRVAQVIFNKPPPPIPKPTPPPPPPPEEKPEVVKEIEKPKPPEKKEVVVANKEQEQKNKGDIKKPDAKAQVAQKAGRASEVKPKDSNLKAKMFTSTKQGGAIKTGETAGANAQSKDKDPTNSGLLAAFGGGGARSKLDKAYSGSGELLGNAEKATGSSGFNENRAGDDLGSKFKDTGAGGKGTATQGIAGVGTKGRGTGMSAFGSGNGFGSKDSVSVTPGGAEESFVGSIDKEAVRRAVLSARAAYKACYDREYKKDTALSGKVMISWEIHDGGIAKNARVVSGKSTLNNSAVENCVRDRIMTIRYPEPPAGTVAEVTFPFAFDGQK